MSSKAGVKRLHVFFVSRWGLNVACKQSLFPFSLGASRPILGNENVPLVLEDQDLQYRELLYLTCTAVLGKQGFPFVIGPAVRDAAISVLPLVCAVLVYT